MRRRMTDKLFNSLALVATLGSGLIAGTFFAFSTFVMKALARLPVSAGLPAMQSINVVVLNPVFLGVFLGTAAACAALLCRPLIQHDCPPSGWVIVGSLLYLAGSFGVTVVRNVPLNDALATLSPDTPDAATAWSRYVTAWTRWNHVRTLAALAATACFAHALRC